MKSPTMTLNECATEMRNHGIRCSEMDVADAIEHGIYPFGRVKRVGNTGRRTFEIWRVDFERWLKERTGGESE